MVQPSFVAITGANSSTCGYCKSSKRSEERRRAVAGDGGVDSGEKKEEEEEEDDEDEETVDESKKTSHTFGMWAYKLTVQAYQSLIDKGWRRSGQYLYKPDMGRTCCPAYTIRLDAGAYVPGRSHRKVGKKVRRFLRGGGGGEAREGEGEGEEGGGREEEGVGVGGGSVEPMPFVREAPVKIGDEEMRGVLVEGGGGVVKGHGE
ncbi:hypothetical protein HDU67_000548, partial [Dinochytrium kinnereticum]